MKRHVKRFFNYIRMTVGFRWLFYPYICHKTKIEINNYCKGNDAAHLRENRHKFSGKRCFIIGNGPSLTIEDLTKIKGEYSFASNGIVHLFDRTEWRPNWYMVVDKIIIEQMNKWDLKCFSGIEMYVYDKEFVEKHRDELNIHYFVRGGKYSIRPERQIMETVSTDISSYFSRSQSIATGLIELAIYLGFNEIILIGFDHSFPVEIKQSGKKSINKDRIHHFDGYKGKVRKVAYVDAITQSYECIKKYADENNIHIINCTRGGHLELFTRAELESLL